ncbi:hypothetical protein AB0H73_06005 [Streptomyces olivoreticuli]
MPFSDAPESAAPHDESPESRFRRNAQRWALIKDRVETQRQLLDPLQESMVEDLKVIGIKDDNGSYLIDLGTSHAVAGKTFSALKWERSVRRHADENMAEILAVRKNLLDRLFPHQRVFDVQEVHVLLQEGLLTEDEVAEIFPEEESFRFVRAGK